jgi:hypothetical protein
MTKCDECGTEFVARVSHGRFCSRACRQKENLRKWRERNRKPDSGYVAPGSTGAMHEMLVCVDLLRKGYAVFRSVSPHSPFDLVAIKEGLPVSLEVTTGCYTTTGRITHPTKDRAKFDHLVIVTHEGEIIYQPPLDE